eukprot:2800688-Pleurochrysis_carterae.AAC.3
MRGAEYRAKDQQAGVRKATRARKAGVNLFAAVEPPLSPNLIFYVRQGSGCAHQSFYFTVRSKSTSTDTA